MKILLLILFLSFSQNALADPVEVRGSVEFRGTVDVGVPPNPAVCDGGVVIETIGENTIDPVASAPYADVWVDNLTSGVKTQTYSTVSTGAHVVRSEVREGLVQSYGMCTYARGGSACTVSSF